MGGTTPTEPTPTPVLDDEKQNGSWNGEVNTPKTQGTGLIPVYHNGTSWVDLTENSTAEEWANWYDYDTQHWANARTADGSMWVWIPRYEYKINSTAKTIDVRFIKTDVKAGTAGYTTDGTGIVTSSDGYIVHPAFMDDTANGFNNGGWDSDIEGFWVAKYPAGWQNGTNGVDISIGTPEYSELVYETSITNNNNTYAGKVTNNSTKISYPIFKSNNYIYNYISVGDAYKISKDIESAIEMYGLKNIDSHLEKNSEWGSVAYLAHSKYGVNGKNIIAQSTRYKNNNPIGVYALTSPEGITNTSTTQNITGVYDLNGGVHEEISGFYSGGSTDYVTGMPIESSNKYVTLYTENNKKGDATKETSGWYGNSISSVDYLRYPYIARGGCYSSSAAESGIFRVTNSNGVSHYYYGFRVVLIPN